MPNPIGLSPALVTADHHLVFGRRNPTLAYYPNRIHPFAGALEPHESPFAGLLRELHEELHLTPADLSSPMRLLGIIEDRTLAHPEFIFHLTTTKTLQDLHHSLDPEEHHALISLPTRNPHSAIRNPADFTPIALGTLHLFSLFNSDTSA
jgi:8-oxo-dGTP pyrophosphatase MutT (NUDIX family)